MKFRPVGAELCHADGRTVRHEGYNSCFSQLRESRLKMTRFHRDVV